MLGTSAGLLLTAPAAAAPSRRRAPAGSGEWPWFACALRQASPRPPPTCSPGRTVGFPATRVSESRSFVSNCVSIVSPLSIFSDIAPGPLRTRAALREPRPSRPDRSHPLCAPATQGRHLGRARSRAAHRLGRARAGRGSLGRREQRAHEPLIRRAMLAKVPLAGLSLRCSRASVSMWSPMT